MSEVLPGGSATYRVQLGPAFPFADAARTVPYLDRLGISHLYVSPVFQANPASAHGYDVVDHSRLSDSLGGEPGFRMLTDALSARGMGLIVDFVPNHMCVDPPQRNPWWWDVLEKGTSSPYARYFDIDWSPVKTELHRKVLLPVLGDPYGTVLERGELRLFHEAGRLRLAYFERVFPISPRSTPLVLREALATLAVEGADSHADGTKGMDELRSITEGLAALPVLGPDQRHEASEREETVRSLRGRLEALLASSERVARHVDAAVRAFTGVPGEPESFDRLHALLEMQAYRLAHWRTAFHEVNYRRFFDVNQLASVRMEEPEVFQAAHGRLFELIREGLVAGVRIDHLDGLTDPPAYLERLAAAAPRAYVVAEKILSPEETPPASWRFHGTTGYDFLNDVGGLFVDPEARRPLQKLYQRFTGRREPFEDVAIESKKAAMESSLASELNMLAHMLNRISEGSRTSRDFTLLSLRDMLQEVVASLTVYRTYITERGHSAGDRERLTRAVASARRRNPAMDPSIFDFFLDVMLHPGMGASAAEAEASEAAGAGPERLEFVLKLQQYASAVQAKGVEDTAFYRYHLLRSLNEVGGSPLLFGRSPEEFHRANRERLARWPAAMTATSTHDTKRGEDARVRLHALTQIPGEWERAVSRWSRANARHRIVVEGARAPDRNDEYLLYQAAIAFWPVGEGDGGGGAGGGESLGPVLARFRAFMQKAIREAKRHTSWIHPHPEYERAVTSFVERAWMSPRAGRFRDDFLAFRRRVARLASTDSLAMAVLHVASPGIPDFYQGSETWNLDLVDPDNRKPVDFETLQERLDALEHGLSRDVSADDRARLVGELLESWTDGRIKTYVIACGLRDRRSRPALYREGAYVPLAADPERDHHVVSFARVHGGEAVIAVVPRLTARLADGPPLGDAAWGEARLRVPSFLAARDVTDLFTGERHAVTDGASGPGLPLASLFRLCPVALLSSRNL